VPQEARRLAERLEIHYNPKHGSWLNMAEIELSVLKGLCLNRRMPDMVTMQGEVAAWEKNRNNRTKKINWQFTTSDARIKLNVFTQNCSCYMVLAQRRLQNRLLIFKSYNDAVILKDEV
jgi:hypothetical protein